MTNKDFKQIKTNMKTFTKNFQFVSGKLISIEINNVTYSRAKANGKLTAMQLQEFEFLDDFSLETPISL